MKGTRWRLLKNPENLDDAQGDRRRLEEALKLNESLAKAYYLKEDLRQFWEQSDRLAASRFLTHWLRKAEASGIRMLKDFARTLVIHRQGLLDWYLCPISTGPSKAPTTKSAPSHDKPMAFAIRNTLSSNSTPFTNPVSYSSDSFGARSFRMNPNSCSASNRKEFSRQPDNSGVICETDHYGPQGLSANRPRTRADKPHFE